MISLRNLFDLIWLSWLSCLENLLGFLDNKVFSKDSIMMLLIAGLRLGNESTQSTSRQETTVEMWVSWLSLNHKLPRKMAFEACGTAEMAVSGRRKRKS